jgi:dipeptidyl aminopeptidase/acylaminoacyl peptidase
MKAPGVSGKARTVVLFNGMDNCKEMSVLFAGLEFAARGMHTLAIDGPGQGESLRLRKIHTRYDYEAAGTAAYNYVASRADVDPKKVTVMGYSFGGYYAPRIVAFDKRYAACVAFGAMHASIYEWVLKIKTVTQSDSTKSAQSAFQVPWVFGAKDIDEALEMSKRFDLEGVAQRIECPVLVVHGEKDRIVPLDSAQKLYDMIGSKRKTYKIFTAEDGGAEHCQVDNRQVGIDYIADWIAANT